jgi:hypothetical protein
MFFQKYTRSFLIVVLSAMIIFYLNGQLLPLVQAQNLSAGLAYLLIFPAISLLGLVHLLRLIVLPFVFLLKKRRKNRQHAYYQEHFHEYY